MFLHFRVFGLCWFQVDDWTVFVYIVNNGSNGVFVCSRHEGGFSLYSCGPSPWLLTYCILKRLLSSVFRSYSIKAVLKLIVCIPPTHDSAGKILVSTVDTLLQQCSLQLYNLSNLGPVHKKTPMNICCHPLRVENWMLQPLTGERTQTLLVKSNIGDISQWNNGELFSELTHSSLLLIVSYVSLNNWKPLINIYIFLTSSKSRIHV